MWWLTCHRTDHVMAELF